MKRSLLTLTAILLLAAPWPAAAMSGKGKVPAAVHPVLRQVKGEVSVKGIKYSVWEPAVERMLVLSGDVIRTGADGFARLEFMSGAIEIYKNSEIVVPSTGEMERKKDILDMDIIAGKARFDINTLGASRQFTFRTADAIGIVKGTRFVVKAGGAKTRVVVYDGDVVVTDRQGTARSRRVITRGQYLTILEHGGETRLALFDADQASTALAAGVEPDVTDNSMASGGDNGERNHGAGQGNGNGNGNSNGQGGGKGR